MNRIIISLIALFLLQSIQAQLFKARVQIAVQHLPNWNTEGMKRIAVMPFENNYTSQQYDLANYLTDEAVNRISETGHFTVISASQVEDLRRRGENLANHVDVLLTGKILNVESKDGSSTSTKGVITFTREVKLEISYSLEQARDGIVIGKETKNGSRGDSNSSRDGLNSVREMLRQTNVLAGIAKNLAPYTVNESRTLMGDKTQGKDLNNRMKIASDQVKGKNYKIAYNMYMGIYEEYESFSAIYNASIMQEALGDIPAAIKLMQLAERETGNQDARAEVTRLRKIISDRERVQQYIEADRPMERVIRYASSEAMKHLPEGTRMFFHNKGGSEGDLASRVIEGMGAAFRQNGGITIVDRENIQRIENELNMQYSGMVSDETMLSIGKRVGANAMITVEISGVGSMRRLKMKVLDIEEGKTLLESDGGSNWEL